MKQRKFGTMPGTHSRKYCSTRDSLDSSQLRFNYQGRLSFMDNLPQKHSLKTVFQLI